MNIRCSTRSIFVWESCSPNPAIKQIIFLRANVIKRNEFTFLDMPPLRKTMLSLIPKHALTTKGRSLPRNSSSKGSGFKASNHGFQIDLAEPPHPKKKLRNLRALTSSGRFILFIGVSSLWAKVTVGQWSSPRPLVATSGH